ncbi:DeoR/GlpR family DNA-binding transcription regulator [Pseudalkalibacillus sp. A8]|uniref:DeoR/GlpR family DNA-binding transcription regulator n=1 Tax=Pseudalkalibacillus sp. A8 TaxID=3382641 RepID=UPI0038B5C188
MFQDERLVKILDYLYKHSRITVTQMMDMYDISRDTARRDLVKLEKQGDITRTRGGALLSTEKTYAEPKDDSGELMLTSKLDRSIAQKAMSLIEAEENLMFDSSISVQYLADILAIPSTVITNSLKSARLLADKTNIDIHLIGGRLNKKSQSLQGSSLLEDIERYYVDKVFIGADGIVSEGISYSNQEEGMVTRAMTKRGDQIIVLANSASFGKQELFKSLSFKEIDILITNHNPDSEFIRILEKFDVKLIVANKENHN